jgi:hypothetical protein
MSSRGNIPGFAALAALLLLVAALMRRRVRLGWLLLHVAVALGERWREGRDHRRIASALSGRAESADSAA